MSMESRSTKSRRRKPPDVFPHLLTRAPSFAGTGIQSGSSRKNGWVRIRQPMGKSLRSSGSTRRYLTMLARISCADRAPFASPNASQASEHGSTLAWAKMPPPPITLRGAWSLNRNSSPGWRAQNFVAEGAQKLTSLRSGCRRSISNQSPSVTAMTRLMPMISSDSVPARRVLNRMCFQKLSRPMMMSSLSSSSPWVYFTIHPPTARTAPSSREIQPLLRL